MFKSPFHSLKHFTPSHIKCSHNPHQEPVINFLWVSYKSFLRWSCNINRLPWIRKFQKILEIRKIVYFGEPFCQFKVYGVCAVFAFYYLKKICFLNALNALTAWRWCKRLSKNQHKHLIICCFVTRLLETRAKRDLEIFGLKLIINYRVWPHIFLRFHIFLWKKSSRLLNLFLDNSVNRYSSKIQ